MTWRRFPSDGKWEPIERPLATKTPALEADTHVEAV
jgi:hypothetical protein